MIALAGPLHLLALVLVISGVQKLLDPRPPADAMVAAGLPMPVPRMVAGVGLGVVETATGLLALAWPHPAAALWLAAFYAALAAFVVRLRRTDATAGCGCFGASSAPPGRWHVALDVTGAVTAATIAVAGVPDLLGVADAGIGALVAYVLLLTTGAGLVLLGPALAADLAQIPHRPRPLAPFLPSSR